MPSVTIEPIESDLFRLEIPLPLPALKSVNCYILRNHERSLVVDTGMNTKGCMDALMEGLQEIGVSLENADLYITHGHGDHMGLVELFQNSGGKVYLNGLDIENLRRFVNFDSIIAYLVRHGFPKSLVQAAVDRFPTDRKKLYQRLDLNFTNVSDGYVIPFGERRLTCVHTPGHSPGHTCLYDSERKILFSGDHILGDISPGIQCVSDDLNPIASYLESLKTVGSLDMKVILPGHRSIIRDPERRITELLDHHRKRCDEVLSLVDGKTGSAYDLAARMTWDLPYARWEDVPPDQRWFATGEAISHLRYLEVEGQVKRQDEGSGPVMFKAA